VGGVGRIPIGDFPLGDEERAALQRVIDSGRISQGVEVRSFEEEFAHYMGTRHCVAVSSGTAALMVGLRAVAVSKQFSMTEGGRILLPALTFIATANAAKLAGMRVMFGDIEPGTMGLSLDAIGTTPVDMVLPVHLMGYSANMTAIRAKCDERKILLAEDAAEAHGTRLRGKLAGTFGLWGAFSFYIAHTVQAGELGCIVTDSAEIARVARQLRAHGRECSCRICTRSTTGCPHLEHGDPRFRSLYVGWNFKAMEFQAALARVQLRHIDENIERRRENVDRLNGHLIDLQESGAVEPFAVQDGTVHIAYPIVLTKHGYRDRVVAELEHRGVEARPLFGCIPTQQPAYAQMKNIYAGRVPVAEHYGADGFYVGAHQYLTDSDVDRMAEIIKDTVRRVVT